MIRDVKLEGKRILIIDPKDKAWLVPDKNEKMIQQIVEASRAKYDAVIVLESASENAFIPIQRLRWLRDMKFIPVLPDVSKRADFGRSYWILEHDPYTKKVFKE